MRNAADRGDTSAGSNPPQHRYEPEEREQVDSEPDFADEHTRPTYADEPATESSDESVPDDRGGAGGMDVR